MPQITVFNSQQQIVDCYIVSVELFEEIALVSSVFDLNPFYVSFLEELESRFLTVLSQHLSQHLPQDFDSQTVNLQIEQNFPWYLELLQLLKHLRSKNANNPGLSLRLIE